MDVIASCRRPSSYSIRAIASGVIYLVQNHREILVEFQKIAELETAAA
jgi:hypothetical protein